jgi:hypothetical protein
VDTAIVLKFNKFQLWIRGTRIIDNEHSVFYETKGNGNAVDVYESNDPEYENMIMIHENNIGVTISIISELQLSEIFKIAENIK